MKQETIKPNGVQQAFAAQAGAASHNALMKGQPIDWNAPIRRVMVFRALNLGDMLCSMPALRALRARLPAAHITLVGLPSATPLMPYFSSLIDELVHFPGDPVFPEQAVKRAELLPFYEAMRSRDFDLALQMHGSGGRANDIVRAMAPVQWGGFVADGGDAVPGRLLAWPDHLHEVHRYLALLTHLGVPAHDDSLAFPVTREDRARADELAARHGMRLRQTIFIHPGARLRSRRWPLERYGALARALARQGWRIAITGSPAETRLAAGLEALIGQPVHNLCGATTLGSLAGLLQQARLLICNDTGISHVAAGVRLPSVVIACGSDVNRWAPLDTARHAVLYASMPCRPCAFDLCPHGHACALEVTVRDVLKQARVQLDMGGR